MSLYLHLSLSLPPDSDTVVLPTLFTAQPLFKHISVLFSAPCYQKRLGGAHSTSHSSDLAEMRTRCKMFSFLDRAHSNKFLSIMSSPLFCSPNAVLRLRFNHFATECSWDHMYVYDGDSVYAPLVAVFR